MTQQLTIHIKHQKELKNTELLMEVGLYCLNHILRTKATHLLNKISIEIQIYPS